MGQYYIHAAADQILLWDNERSVRSDVHFEYSDTFLIGTHQERSIPHALPIVFPGYDPLKPPINSRAAHIARTENPEISKLSRQKTFLKSFLNQETIADSKRSHRVEGSSIF